VTVSTDAKQSVQDLTALPVRYLCSIDIDFHPVQVVPTAAGTRMVFAAKRGTVTGPGLTGEIVPGSADWLVVGADRIARIDVRAAIRTNEDDLIYMTNTGRVRLGPHIDRFFAGELITAGEAYIRTAPLFDTTAERYAHLTSSVTVAFCDLSLNEIHYRVYTVD
jgi:hypothetical protein